MTAEQTTEPSKPIWTRCKGSSGEGNGCGQRVYNDRIDIEKHRQHCPADLERLVDNLEKRIDALEKTELPEPVDLDEVAEWPADSGFPDNGFDDDPRSTYADDTLPETTGYSTTGFAPLPGTIA